jgi:menaquinol-cytochrome c reductase iron-sulfur subunit
LVGRPFSIDADQNPYELKGPGEPVTGVLANLYPF